MESPIMVDQLDSLEGWVSVKQNPFFDNLLPPKLTFLIAWNEIELKIAVSCRDHARVVSDTEDYRGRSGLFSFQEIRGAHEMLCLIHPSLSTCLPDLPDESRGLWAFFSPPQTPENIDEICNQLENYFKISLEVCKEKLLMSVLFEEHSTEDYFENISELRRRGKEEAVNNHEDELKNVIKIFRDGAVTMFDMKEAYKLEDEVVFKLNVALAELYNYQLQPFLDMRELAVTKLREARGQLQNPDLGERRKQEYAEMFTEWQGHYEQALETIQDVYINYYKATSSILKGMRNRMLEDQKKYGKNAFDLIGAERLLRIEEDLCLEKIQYLHNEKKKFVQERDKVKEEIASTRDCPGVKKIIEDFEYRVYDWQVKIYEHHLLVLDEESKLAKTQRRAITRKIEDAREEVVFYDAVEDTSVLSSDEEEETISPSSDPRVITLTQQLISIQRKRAKIRTRKTSLIQQYQSKAQHKQEEKSRYLHHHAINKKIEERKEGLAKKQEFICDERKKTIDRLKNFKMKYPTPVTIKPLRYQSLCEKDMAKTTNTHKSGPRKFLRKSQPSSIPPKPCDGKPKSPKTTKGQDGGIVKEECPSGLDTPDIVEDTPQLMNTQFASLPFSKISTGSIPPQIAIPPPPPPPPPLPPMAPPPPPPLPPPPPPLPTMAPVSNIPPFPHKKQTSQKETSTKASDSSGGMPSLQNILDIRKLLKKPSDTVRKEIHTTKDPMDSIMEMIKKGVPLRTTKDKGGNQERKPPLSPPSDSHLKLLTESLHRINRVTRGSSPDSDNEDSDDTFDD